MIDAPEHGIYLPVKRLSSVLYNYRKVCVLVLCLSDVNVFLRVVYMLPISVRLGVSVCRCLWHALSPTPIPPHGSGSHLASSNRAG